MMQKERIGKERWRRARELVEERLLLGAPQCANHNPLLPAPKALRHV